MNIIYKLRTLFLTMIMVTYLCPMPVFADAIVGKSIVTIGKDLSPQQRKEIIMEMHLSADNVEILEITNREEHQYLDKVLSDKVIGNRAISSARVTIQDKGRGIAVKTNNIAMITESMYANAAITAGIKDVDIYVTAPFRVSGTAGLTGIIKAFETATGKKITETQKLIANEEIVRTSELGKQIGDADKAAQFMSKVKEQIAKVQPQTVQEYHKLITNMSNQFNVILDKKTVNNLVEFSQSFSDLNIDWHTIKDQVSKLRGSINEILNNEETQGIIHSVFKWLGTIFSYIGEFFSSSSQK